MKWCITHEMFIEDDDNGNPDGKCVITFCAPPKLDMSDEWLYNLHVPNAEESAHMNQVADELWFDFIGE